MDDRTAILLVSASEKDANMYYATRLFVPDAFIYLRTSGESVAVIGNLELERAREHATVDRVLPLAQYWKLAQDKHQKTPSTGEIVDILLREFGVDRVIVPPDFSLKFADSIRSYGYTVEAKPEPFFEERMVKTADEIELMRQTIQVTEAALASGIDLIRTAKIGKDDVLMRDGKPLASSHVRQAVHCYLTMHECVASHTVVSCGEQTTSPHQEGAGSLYANQPIIIDCSPKSFGNGYYADLTRTVVRGKASDPLRRQYETVIEAQQHAYSLLKPGASGKDVHAAVAKFLDDRGYKTHAVDGKPQGFFHATGHGIGLEGHERPHLALRDHVLSSGNILAIEPALYYSGVGGVRIEDDVLVMDDGVEVLSTLDRTLEI